MTFSKWKGRNYVRQLVTPANPQTVKQVSVRAMMRFLSQEWAGLTAPEQATWDDLAAAGQYAPFNAYMKKNLERWRNFLAPSKEYPAAEGDLAAVLGAITATGGVGQITLSQVITTANQNWSLLIFRSLTGTFTPSFSNLIRVVNGEGAGPIVYVDTPLTPGAYFYELRGGSVEGVTGASSAEATATAT
jgi:hypothetical protein